MLCEVFFGERIRLVLNWLWFRLSLDGLLRCMPLSYLSDAGFNVFFFLGLVRLLKVHDAFTLFLCLLFKFYYSVFLVTLCLNLSFSFDLFLQLKLFQEIFMSHQDAIRIAWMDKFL